MTGLEDGIVAVTVKRRRGKRRVAGKARHLPRRGICIRLALAFGPTDKIKFWIASFSALSFVTSYSASDASDEIGERRKRCVDGGGRDIHAIRD